MAHRDRAGDPAGHRAGSREAAGPAEHRSGFLTPSGEQRTRPGRRLLRGFRPQAPWRTSLGFWTGPPSCDAEGIAATGAPSRKPREAVSMGIYH